MRIVFRNHRDITYLWVKNVRQDLILSIQTGLDDEKWVLYTRMESDQI